MSSAPTVGIIAPLVAKPSQETEIKDFLLKGRDTVSRTEPLTLEWFALQHTSSGTGAENTTFGIFDTFAHEEGREAHTTGHVAVELAAKASIGTFSSVDIAPVVILTSKRKPLPGATGVTAGLSKGLKVVIKAKEQKITDVRSFLIDALPAVEAEDFTSFWYAIEYPGTNVFGIIDFFVDDAGRNAHVAGKVAEALFASVDELLTGPPEIVTVDVVAAKV